MAIGVDVPSLGEVLAQLEKVGEIKTSPRQLFTYVPFPEDLRQRFEGIAKHVVPGGRIARDLDHVTLLYIPKAEVDVANEKVDQVVRAMRDVCENVRPIKAKVQGWGYFDGAMDDGVEKTALVGLIDAPGLEDLHVELKSTVRQLGLKEAGTHIFTPHVTFAYLDKGERVKDLPILDGEFTIDHIVFANRDKHEVRLEGDKSIGEKAAAAATHFGHQVAAGMKVEHTAGRTAEKAKSIVLARLRKDPQAYAKQAGVVVSGEPTDIATMLMWLKERLRDPLAKEAADRCKVCDKPATVKVLWAEGRGYQPACEAHKEQVAKPFKAKDDFSGFKKVSEFSLSTSAIRQEPREKDDYKPGAGTADAGGTGGVLDNKPFRFDGEKGAAHIDELREALRRIGMVRVGKAPLVGPHLNEALMKPAMTAGGATGHLDFFGLPSPRTPAGQKATNILGGMHEGFERSAVGKGDRAGFHGHASPRVLLDENNMLARLRGAGADEAKRVFGAMRGTESPEAQEVSQAVSRLSGGRMPFSYGETKLPKAMKGRLDELLRRLG